MRFRCASCQVMTSSTSLSAPEVKALYARFRRLAPTGRGCVSTLDVDIPKPHPSTIAIFVLKTLSDETEMHVTRRECLFESWKHRTRSLGRVLLGVVRLPAAAAVPADDGRHGAHG